MRTIALLSRKGGAGKTTLALHLAVIAQQAGRRVVLVDCDPQRSAADWWRAREADDPAMVETDAGQLPAVIEAARADGVGLVVVDTRPSVEADAVAVARAADLVLIPTRPAILDLRAIGGTVDVVRAVGARAAVVLNGCPPGQGFGPPAVVREARRGLAGYGLPVAPVAVTLRAAMAHALIGGAAVTEYEPAGKAASEMRKLWAWIEGQLWASARH